MAESQEPEHGRSQEMQQEMPQEEPLTVTRVAWLPDYTVGHAELDGQHQGLLVQCEVLADLCTAAEAPQAAAGFDAAFEQLKRLVRAHFQTEAALLADRGLAAPDDLHDELDEFEYLVEEIVTTENFDRLELQRFLSLWCLGHIAGTAAALREQLGRDGAR